MCARRLVRATCWWGCHTRKNKMKNKRCTHRRYNLYNLLMLKTQITVRRAKERREICARNKLVKNKLIAFLCRIPCMFLGVLQRAFFLFVFEFASERVLCAISWSAQTNADATRHRDQDVCLISAVMIIKFLMRAQRCWNGNGRRRRRRSILPFCMPVSDDEKRRHIRIVFVRFSFRSALSVVAADTVDSAYYCLLLKVEAENDRCLRSVGVLVTTHLGNLLVILALRVLLR